MQVSTPLQRVEYSRFATRIVAVANRRWRLRHPGRGDWLLDRDGLHRWLYRWGIESGRLEDPGPRPASSPLSYAAALYAADPAAVLEAAREFWRHRVWERLGQDQQEAQLEWAGRV